MRHQTKMCGLQLIYIFHPNNSMFCFVVESPPKHGAHITEILFPNRSRSLSLDAWQPSRGRHSECVCRHIRFETCEWLDEQKQSILFFFFFQIMYIVWLETIQLSQKFSLTNLCTIIRGNLQKLLVKKWSGFRSWRFQLDFQFYRTPFSLITKIEKRSLWLLELSWHQYDYKLVCCSQAGHFTLLDINSQNINLRQHDSDK